MFSLGQGRHDRSLGVLPVVHDLLITETQNAVPQQQQTPVLTQVPISLVRLLVGCMTIELQNEAFADEPIDAVPVDDDLLSHVDPERLQSHPRDRLDSRVCEASALTRDSAKACRPCLQADQMLAIDQAGTNRGLCCNEG